MKKYAYVTLLVGDELLGNVLILYSSWKATGSKIPFKVVTTIKDNKINLSLNTIELFHSLGVDLIVVPERFITNIKQEGYDWLLNWDKAINKLQIFGLTDYDKLIYLDADLWVWGNLDYLFEKPHMTCPIVAEGDDLCSALMVIEPSGEEYRRIVDKYNELIKGYVIHDQLVLQKLNDGWIKDKSRQIPYPEFTYYYEFEKGEWYDKAFYDNIGKIKVIHYGGKKPNEFTTDELMGMTERNGYDNTTLLILAYRNYWDSVVKDLKTKGLETPYMNLLEA